MSDLRESLAVQYALNDRYAREKGLGFFLDATTIASAPIPKVFGDAADDWQRELIAPKIPAVNAVAGITDPTYNGPRRFLDILARGHDKSSLEGRIANFLLGYSRSRITGYIIAADKDQGKLVIQAMKDEAALNPWYAHHLKFSRYEVTGPGGQFEVVPADASGSFGFKGNFYILDEVTHWSNGVGKKVYETIASGWHKVPGTVVVGIMNAWIKGSWQEELLIRPAMADPSRWVTFYREGNLATWTTEADRADARSKLPPAVAARLLDNVPIDPVTEAGYLSVDDVAACETPLLVSHSVRTPGHRYVLSVDLGLTRDRAVLFRGHLDEVGQAITDEMVVLEGKNFPTNRVSIAKVDEWLDDQIKRFRPSAIVIDQYQMEATIQRLELKGQPVARFNFRGGAGNMELAMALRNFISTRKLRWSPSQGLVPGAKDDTFAKELTALVTKVMPYGWRLDHTSGKHDDRAVAVGAGLMEMVRFPFVPEEKNPGGLIVKTSDRPEPYDQVRRPAPSTNPLTGR